jgi:hypothetical protein
MPEKVTREEKIVELAILKARESLEQLRDGLTKDEMPTIEKVKRPKAKASKHGIKQDKVHANAGGEEFKSGNIKKMTNDEIRAKVAYSQKLVNTLDAQIRLKEKQFKNKKMNAEQKSTLKLMKERVEAIYKALTLMQNQKYKTSEDEKMTKRNEATDRSEDPRDTTFTIGMQRGLTSAFNEMNKEIKRLTKKLLSASVNDLGKIESDLREVVADLKKLTEYAGRSK